MELTINDFLADFKKRCDLNTARFLCFDFDGTIKPLDKPVAAADKEALKSKAGLSCVRVVATGRTVYSFEQDWEPGLDIDFLIFSSGLGICRWTPAGRGKVISTQAFSNLESEKALGVLTALKEGFFAHGLPPDNHRCLYKLPQAENLDFQGRLQVYQDIGEKPWPQGSPADPWGFNKALDLMGGFSQFVVMVKTGQADSLQKHLEAKLKDLSILRVTSPSGRDYRWLEILPPQVCKSQAADFLARKLNFSANKTIAFGNDYNDGDMLAWAHKAYITSDGPKELTAIYPRKPPAGSGGLARIIAEIS